MKQVRGIWMPSSDVHLVEQVNNKVNPLVDRKGTYQLNKYRAALEHVARRGHAVDVGANVGLWSRVMVKDFRKVTAIEPVAEHRACFARNVSGAHMLPFAVGAEARSIRINVPPEHIASAHVADEGEDVDMVTLDSLELGHVDFLKIDIEGYEFDALMGGERMIRKAKPVIIVEQKPGNGERYGRGQTDAIQLLESWGMITARVIGGDYVMVWE